MSKTVQWECEATDTFAGEANYCWVKRETLTLPAGLSDRAVARHVKQALGYAGMRGRSYWHGDEYEFRPYGVCHVVFARVA